MAEKLEELQLPKAQVEIESRGAIYAVPFFKDAELEKPSPSPEDAPGPVARHPPLDTSVSSGHPSTATPFPTAPRQASPPRPPPQPRLAAVLKTGEPVPRGGGWGGTGTVGDRAAAGREPSRHGVGGAATAAMPGLGCEREAAGRQAPRSGALVGARVAPAVPIPPTEGAPTAGAPVPRRGAAHKSAARGHASVPPSAGVRHAGSVPDRGLAAQIAGEGCWQAEGEEARRSGEGLSTAPTAGKPVPGSGAEPELGPPRRVRGDNVTRAQGRFCLPYAGVAPPL